MNAIKSSIQFIKKLNEATQKHNRGYIKAARAQQKALFARLFA